MLGRLYASGGKRALDVAASLAGLVVLSPLLLAVAVLLKLADPGPVLFSQERVGRYFRPFRLFKFRTMRVASGTGGPQVTTGGDPRVTPIGRFLRRTKLDELPQLFNFLRGDMSLVGPRPEVPKYVELFRRDYGEVLSVRPGITDHAAIEFRDEEERLKAFADPEKGYVEVIMPIKLALYRRYIAEVGLSTDLRLILATFLRIAR